MAQTAMTVRMDNQQKAQFDKLCEQFGMSANTAINIFVKAVIRSKSIPFSIQAILGLCFDGIERLGEEYPEEQRLNPIGRELLMTWMGKAQQIRRQNRKVNTVASKLFSMLREDGLRCSILKGQGNALMYPNPYSRTPGDIDVWVNASREEITEYAKCYFKLEDDIRFHHL